jgi:hypothetical protein
VATPNPKQLNSFEFSLFLSLKKKIYIYVCKEFNDAKGNEPHDLRVGKISGLGYIKLRGLPWKTREP